jgi:hypothetical protein
VHAAHHPARPFSPTLPAHRVCTDGSLIYRVVSAPVAERCRYCWVSCARCSQSQAAVACSAPTCPRFDVADVAATWAFVRMPERAARQGWELIADTAVLARLHP